MARYVDPRRVEKYFQWRTRGATKTFAAKEAGLAYSTAKRIEDGRNGDNAVDYREARETRQVQPPKKKDQLRKEALAALDDFALFQRRYLGHIATPWQEEAAVTVVEKLASPGQRVRAPERPALCR